MRRTAGILLLAAAFFLTSCAPSARRADEAVLTQERFRLAQSDLTGAVPKGWTARPPSAKSSPDTAAAMTLLAGDSLSIVFRPVMLDSSAAAYFRRRGVDDLAMLTRTLSDSTIGNVREGIETFRAGGRDFAEFEARANGRKTKVALFRAGDSWYACEAASSKALRAPKSYDDLWTVHRAVLRSLK